MPARVPARCYSERKSQSGRIPAVESSDLSYSLRHNFSDRFHALGRGVGVNNGRAVARNFPGRKGAAFENAVQNFFDAKSKTVRFGESFDLRFAVARSQYDCKLSEAVITMCSFGLPVG